jgi:hypothetical protein
MILESLNDVLFIFSTGHNKGLLIFDKEAFNFLYFTKIILFVSEKLIGFYSVKIYAA